MNYTHCRILIIQHVLFNIERNRAIFSRNWIAQYAISSKICITIASTLRQDDPNEMQSALFINDRKLIFPLSFTHQLSISVCHCVRDDNLKWLLKASVCRRLFHRPADLKKKKKPVNDVNCKRAILCVLNKQQSSYFFAEQNIARKQRRLCASLLIFIIAGWSHREAGLEKSWFKKKIGFF